MVSVAAPLRVDDLTPASNLFRHSVGLYRRVYTALSEGGACPYSRECPVHTAGYKEILGWI